jgi:hypothetical protein
MADTQQSLKVLLQVQADTAEIQSKLNPALAETKAQLTAIGATAAETNAAISGGLPGQTLAINQEAFNIQLEREASLREAMLATTVETAVVQNEVAAASLLTGANLGKARQEALVLAREVATGSVNFRTIGSFIGAWGPAITIAGIAAFSLFEIIKRQVDESGKFYDDLTKAGKEFDKINEALSTSASRATTFGDNIRIADKVQQELVRMEADMAAFRAKELPLWQRFWDDIKTGNDNLFDTHGVLAAPGAGGTGPYEAARQAAALKQEKDEAVALNKTLDEGTASQKRFQDAQADLTRGVNEYTGLLATEQAKLDAIDAKRKADRTNLQLVQQYVAQKAVVGSYTEQLDKLSDELLKQQKSAHGAAEGHKEFSAGLREDTIHLEAIRGLMAAVDNDPFATVFQKANAEIKLIPQALQVIQNDIAKQKALIKGGGLDPVQLEQARQKLLQLNLAAIQFGQTLQKDGKFASTLKSDLIGWANQFGVVAHQVSGLITNSIGTAIQGVSSGITGLIFHTQSLGQAFLQVAESIVQSLIQVALQMIAQKILGSTLASESATEQIATGQAVAQGLAAAAAFQSTISYGAAAAAGTIGLGAAVTAAMSMAAFAEGGPIMKPTLALMGEKGEPEFVVSGAAVRNIGLANLEAAHQSWKSPSASGGSSFVGALGSSGSKGSQRPTIHQHLIFMDANAMAKHIARTPHLETSVVKISNSRGAHLRR